MIYIVQVEFDDDYMFFTREEDAKQKVEELRRQSLETYRESYAVKNDLNERFKYETVHEGQLWTSD